MKGGSSQCSSRSSCDAYGLDRVLLTRVPPRPASSVPQGRYVGLAIVRRIQILQEYVPTISVAHHHTHAARRQTWTCPASSSCVSGSPSWPSSCTTWSTLAGVGITPPRGTLNGSVPPPTPVQATRGDPDIGTSLVITRALLRLTRKTRLPPRAGALDSGLAQHSARWEAICSTEASRSHARMTGKVRNPVSGLRGDERALTEGRGPPTWGLSERVLVMEDLVRDEEQSRVDVKLYIHCVIISWTVSV